MDSRSIDPDIAEAFGDQSQPTTSTAPTQAIDPDVAQAFQADSADTGSDAPTSGSSLWNKIKGFGETSIHVGSGMVAGLGGGLSYLGTLIGSRDAEAAKAVKEETERKLTYEPKTAEGKKYSQAVDEAGQYLGPKEGAAAGERISDLATHLGASPQVAGYVGASVNAGVNAIPYALGARGAKGAPETIDPQEAVNKAYAESPQSMGASAAAPDLSKISPELRDKFAVAAKAGAPINQDVATRHIEADSLPVPVRLTEGQATQDPMLLSREQNTRGQNGGALAQHFNEQGKQLAQNMDAIRDNVGPEVFTNNPVDHGETLIQAYKDKASVADQAISAKYQALKDANGGQFPVDAQKLSDNAAAALHKDLLFDHAPKAIMSTLGKLADNGNMTFENFESLRTNLARIQRSPMIDGNEKAAAGIIRNSMEELPLSPGAAKLKPLADEARQSARAQFQALDADPAYKAAVRDSVPADRFAQKYIIGAPREDVATMRANLAHDPNAIQTMGVATVDHLRRAAGLDQEGNGNFSQAKYNKTLQALDPKLESLLDPEHAEQLGTLGRVARYTQAQPRGSFVNNSNTLVGALAEHGAHALEGVVNVAAKGVPVGTMGRKFLQGRAAKKEVQQALEPGAGLTYQRRNLSDLMKK